MYPSRRHLLAMLASLFVPFGAQAQVAQLRIASVVPKNSLYHQSLLELGETWRTAQGAGARFTVFTDGSQGSIVNPDFIRLGQRHRAGREDHVGNDSVEFIRFTG